MPTYGQLWHLWQFWQSYGSFGNGSWMRVFACIDAPGNDLTTTREVSPSVHLHRPVPACRGSVTKVLPLLLFIRRGQRPFCPFQAYSRRIELALTVAFWVNLGP